MGLLIAPIAESALRRVPEEDKGIASGLLTLSRNIGMTVGLAVASLGTEQFLLTAPGLEEMIERPEAGKRSRHVRVRQLLLLRIDGLHHRCDSCMG